MNKKFTLSILGMLFFSLQLLAQTPNLTGANSVSFNNSNPCEISVSFGYTNNGSTPITSSFKNALYLTEDMFFADPDFDIFVAEVTNSQGCNVSEQRVVTFNNMDISQLPGLVSGTTYYAYVILDRDDTISESDEDDNINAVGTTACVTVGAEEALEESLNLSLSPNPATDRVSISLLNAHQDLVEVRVFDLQGRKFAEQKSVDSPLEFRTSFDTSEWPAGLYAVSIQIGKQVFHKRLQVN